MIKVKVKVFPNKLGLLQRVRSRSIDLFMLYLNARIGYATSQALYLRDAHDAWWAPLPVWTGKRKSLTCTRTGIRNRLAGGESLHQLRSPCPELPAQIFNSKLDCGFQSYCQPRPKDVKNPWSMGKFILICKSTADNPDYTHTHTHKTP